nr:MAG TPA: hypothetical protein [Caudoviricetes sp.]
MGNFIYLRLGIFIYYVGGEHHVRGKSNLETFPGEHCFG